MFFHSDHFFNFCCLFHKRFSAAYLLNLFRGSFHNVFILLALSGVTNLCLLAGQTLVFVQSVCWYTDVSSRSCGQPWWLSPFHPESTVDVTIRLFWQFFTPRTLFVSCSFPWCNHCLIFANHLVTRMVPVIDIISRCFCLQQMRRLCFPKNNLVSFHHNMKSTVHVPRAEWLILCCSALARTHNHFNNFLSTIHKTFTMFWYDTSHCCLCLQSSVSSPLHHLSYCHLRVLICLLESISFFSCFFTSFSATPLRSASLTLLLNVEWQS